MCRAYVYARKSTSNKERRIASDRILFAPFCFSSSRARPVSACAYGGGRSVANDDATCRAS